MLENVPRPVGKLLKGARAGMEKITFNAVDFARCPDTIAVTSSAFDDGAELPARFTADGEKLSPPLQWSGVPTQTAGLVLLIEDPDAPSPKPLVHCIAWNLAPGDGSLSEGELKSAGAAGAGHELGRNSFLSAQYLPPDPPPGHGPHRYTFQLFALDRRLELGGRPGRSGTTKAMRGHVLAKGMLVGVYERR